MSEPSSFVVKNGMKILSCLSGGIPAPLSDTVISVNDPFLVGMPFAVWLGRDWRNDFSSQLSNPWIYYIAAGAGALLLALLTTGVLTFRAANMKPVHTLGSE